MILNKESNGSNNDYSKYKDWLASNKNILGQSKLKAFEQRQKNEKVQEDGKQHLEAFSAYWQTGRSRVKSDLGMSIFDAINESESKNKINIIKKSDKFTLGSYFEWPEYLHIFKSEDANLVRKPDETRLYSQYVNGKNSFVVDSTCSEIFNIFDEKYFNNLKDKKEMAKQLTEYDDQKNDDKIDEEADSSSDDDIFTEKKVDFRGIVLDRGDKIFSKTQKDMINDLETDVNEDQKISDHFKKDINVAKDALASKLDVILDDHKDGYIECFPIGDAMEVEYGQKDFKEFKEGKGDQKRGGRRGGKMGVAGQWKIIEKRLGGAEKKLKKD